MDASRRAFLRGRPAEAPVAGAVARIGEHCLARRQVECRVCGEACDAGAIRFAPRLGGVAQPQVDAARCTGCGDCVAPCPVGAVALGRGTPA